MTSPAPVDVKGQGKARGRRRSAADGPTIDASGPPDNRPDAHDENAASQAASTDASESRGAADGSEPEGAGPTSEADPVATTHAGAGPAGEPDATGRRDALGPDQINAEDPFADPPEQRSVAGRNAGTNPAARARTAARQRREQERADQASEIEAAALTGVPESRRRRRDQKRAEAAAAAAAAAASGGTRREQRARKRAAIAGEGDAPPEESRRGRRAGRRAAPHDETPVAKPSVSTADDREPPPRNGPVLTGAVTAAVAAAAGAAPAPSGPAVLPTPRPAPAEERDVSERQGGPSHEQPDEEDEDEDEGPSATGELTPPAQAAKATILVGGPGPVPAEPETDEGARFVPRPPPEAVRRPPVRLSPPVPPAGAEDRDTRTPRPLRPPPAGGGRNKGRRGRMPDNRRPSGKQVPRAVVLRQRRRRRRTIIVTTALLVVVNLLAGSAYVYFQWRLDQINRVEVPGLAEDVPGEVMNVLLVGSDSRERLTGQDAAQAGKEEVGGQRSDTIMVLHVDPREQRAAILAVPRDLYLPIPGTEGSDRVNAAFAIGGAERLTATLAGIGIEINHYAEVDFVGFREIVDAIGGVEIFLPAPSRDLSSAFALGQTGCVPLSGTQALAYVRSRELQTLVNGEWVTDPRADLGRIERQQTFIRQVMKKGVSAGISNPFALNRLIGIGVRNLTVDETMSTSDITDVARRFRSVDPESVETLVLPTTPRTIDGRSVLVLSSEDAQDEIAKINGAAPIITPTTLPPPSTSTPPSTTRPLAPADYRIRILNGTGVKGAAAALAQTMELGGVSVVGTGDAQPAEYSRTLIRYAPGQEAKATSFQSALSAGADLEKDSTLKSADLTLILGKDYTGFKEPGSSTPTTGPPPGAGAGGVDTSC